MWPRILLELLPHLTRLVPAADKFFASRSASEKAQEEALAALSEHVRGGINGVCEEQAGLRRQLQEQSGQIAQVGVEVTRARLGVESLEARVGKLEQMSQRILWSLASVLLLQSTIFILILLIFTRLKAH